MDEQKVEDGVKESLKKKLVRSRLKWAGHVERMGDEKLAKRSDTQKVEGKRRRVRPRMRWEIGKVWEENGEQQQQIDGVGDCCQRP